MVMADINDRDRGKRRRRRGGRKEFEYNSKPVPPTKTPIILAKPPSEKNANRQLNSNHYEERSKSPERQTSKPIQVLKSRDGPRDDGLPDSPRGLVTSNAQSIPNLLAGDGVPQQVYTLQSRNPVPTNQTSHHKSDGSTGGRLAAPPEMTQCVKLIDESFNWCDTAMDMLLDQNDYLVVGVLGLQGVGKSTVLSYLAGSTPHSSVRSQVFRGQGRDLREVCAHQTQGIDMFITGERVILLDTQPLLSSSVLDHLIHHDKKYSSEYTSVENWIEMQSLQIASFLMTVCNVVIVTMDWFVDVNLLRLVQTAEMLKPPTPASHDGSNSDDSGEHYPHIVFLNNKSSRENFTVDAYNSMQTFLGKCLEHSKLKHKGAVSMTPGTLLRGMKTTEANSKVNLFLLPKKEQEKNTQTDGVFGLLEDYRGNLPSEKLVKSFRNQIFSAPRHLLTHTTLSEKNWFHYAARTWDSVKKASLSEYNRLLP